MPDVRMYCTQTCPYCNRAEMLLNKKGIKVKKIFVDKNPAEMNNMIKVSNNRRTVPQIFIGELHVGGFDDLAELNSEGKLDSLLQ